MILPSKHGGIDRSLLVLGAHLLELLEDPQELGVLWQEVRDSRLVHSFDRFYQSVILLNVLGAIDVQDGLLVRLQRQ